MMTALTKLNEKDGLSETFRFFKESRVFQDPSWLAPLRENAFNRFIETGFPTIRDEEWKYTSLEPVFAHGYSLDRETAAQGLDLQHLQPFLIEEREWPRLVFINGFCSPESSFIPADFAGLEAGSLREAVNISPPAAKLGWNPPVSLKSSTVTAFNEAFWTDGFFFHLPKGKQFKQPIHLLFITAAKPGEKPLVVPQNVICLEENAQATIIESHVSIGKGVHFSNALTKILLQPGAQLSHYRIQQESPAAFHLAVTQVCQSHKSVFNSHTLSVGSRIAREDLNVYLNEDSSCSLKGLYVVREGQHRDHHTLIDHAKPRGKSEQVYKGIMGARSRAVFNGKILVREDAQQTDAQQLNKNLLLGDGAIIDAKPQLEIFADDVKCTHGAAVGEMDPAQLFYLKSRGMSEEGARHLLTRAFANEIILNIPIELVRFYLEKFPWQQLEQ